MLSEIRVPSLLVGGDLAAGSKLERVPLYAPRPGWGEGVTFAARGREVALWGLTCYRDRANLGRGDPPRDTLYGHPPTRVVVMVDRLAIAVNS